jgi:hypothetical protein
MTAEGCGPKPAIIRIIFGGMDSEAFINFSEAGDTTSSKIIKDHRRSTMLVGIVLHTWASCFIMPEGLRPWLAS